MSYTLSFRESFVINDLPQLPRHLQKRLEKINAELRDDPTRQGGNIKKLKGFEYLWRYRVADYRIIYAVVDEYVEFLAAGPRRDIYERFHYDPASPDETIAIGVEARLFPNSPVAQRLHERRYYEDWARQQQEELIPELPGVLTRERLTQWEVPELYHPAFMECRTVADLESLEHKSIPADLILRVMDRIWPRSAEVLADDPVRIVQSDTDFTRFIEGEISEFLLKLDAQQAYLVDWALSGPTMVKGGPGSGKSTVAMYRARAWLERGYREHGRAPTILFMTYTNALVSATAELLNRLLADLPNRCEVSTVDSIAMDLYKRAMKCRDVRIAGRAEWEWALRFVRPKFTPASGNSLLNLATSKLVDQLPDDYLVDEFEWIIEGRALRRVRDYLSADRTGRGIGMQAKTRRVVWQLYSAVKRRLEGEGLVTWGSIRRVAADYMRGNPDAQRWDYVIIDEAQDLTPIALHLCTELARDPRNIFLAAESSQSIYNRGFSYSKVHEELDVAHRTRHLHKNYRSTQEIVDAAREIIQGTGADDEEALEQPCVHFGPKPILAVADNETDQIVRIVDFIKREARLMRMPAAAAAILCPTNKLADRVAELCNQHGLPARYMRGRELELEVPEVKVLTIHSAKGLEFPIVVLPYLNRDILPHIVPDGPDNPDEHERHERRIFFVGATRAMRSLMVISSRHSIRSPFLETLTSRHWNCQ